MQHIETMLDSNSLVAALIWSSVGFGIALFGWRQKAPRPLLGGIAMIALSYSIRSVLYMSLAAVALIAGLILLKRRA